VEEAADGAEGIALARAVHPAAILLDVLMPGLDGWAILGQLRADAEVAEIPIVMISILREKQLGLALGASEYLTKPIDRAHLRRTLARYRTSAGDGPVLVVEDDAESRRVLVNALQREGFTVDEAEDGRAALARVVAQRPAAILLDLIMPTMDGLTFLTELRQRREWRDIPVVVVTAKDLTAAEREQLDGQVSDVLAKGAYSAEDLLADLRQLVRAPLHAPPLPSDDTAAAAPASR
jgi:CheY-like chemotaxis protein